MIEAGLAGLETGLLIRNRGFEQEGVEVGSVASANLLE